MILDYDRQGSALGTKTPITLLLVDDNPIIRQGLRMWLGLEPDFEIAGEAANGCEAVALARQLRPDVTLIDVEMPKMDGIEATAALRREVPETKVIVLSLHEDEPTRARALSAGAAAFVGKGTGEASLLATIRALLG
jgi:DNA-binding NarL/FixJ family response regulator